MPLLSMLNGIESNRIKGIFNEKESEHLAS